MTTIGSIIPTTTSTAASDSADLIGNYETFLTLLTTQLKNQDPMEPMKSEEFTNQLVQYSTVEQQIKSNEQLENLTAMMTSNNALAALNFVDTTVTIDGSKGYLGSYGSVNYSFNAEEAGTATMVVRNQNGEIVANIPDVAVSAGDQSWKWNGMDAAGNRLANGTYSVQIIAATTDGNDINISSDSTGKVTHVDVSGTEPMLTVNDQTIKMNQIKAISSGTTASS